MIGPYSYLAGAIALDLGGKAGGATTSGTIDAVGYLGEILAGDTRSCGLALQSRCAAVSP
jgi:hypothetical protein